MSAAPEALAELLARWDVPADAELTPAGRGTNNQTVTVAHRGRRWALRISQNLSTAQVQAEHRLLARLRAAGLPFRVPEPVPAADGGSVLWRAGRWRRGQASLTGVTERLDRLEQTMRWLDASAGQLLSILAGSL